MAVQKNGHFRNLTLARKMADSERLNHLYLK